MRTMMSLSANENIMIVYNNNFKNINKPIEINVITTDYYTLLKTTHNKGDDLK